MKTKTFLAGLILASILAIPSDASAGIIRRFLARRAAPRATAVQVNVGRVGVAVAVRRGAAVQRNIGVRRGFNGGFRRGR